MHRDEGRRAVPVGARQVMPRDQWRRGITKDKMTAQLQQELSGLTLRTRSAHGHVTDVGLSETMGRSAACGGIATRIRARGS